MEITTFEALCLSTSSWHGSIDPSIRLQTWLCVRYWTILRRALLSSSEPHYSQCSVSHKPVNSFFIWKTQVNPHPFPYQARPPHSIRVATTCKLGYTSTVLGGILGLVFTSEDESVRNLPFSRRPSSTMRSTEFSLLPLHSSSSGFRYHPSLFPAFVSLLSQLFGLYSSPTTSLLGETLSLRSVKNSASAPRHLVR